MNPNDPSYLHQQFFQRRRETLHTFRVFIVSTLFCVMAVFSLLWLFACTPKKEAAAVTGLGNQGQCLVTNRHETPEVIADRCGIQAVEDVVKVLFAMRAAQCPMVRAPGIDAGPGK